MDKLLITITFTSYSKLDTVAYSFGDKWTGISKACTEVWSLPILYSHMRPLGGPCHLSPLSTDNANKVHASLHHSNRHKLDSFCDYR